MELSWPFSKFVIKSQSEFSGVTFQSSLSGVEEIYFLLKWQGYGVQAIDGKTLSHIQANIVLFVKVGLCLVVLTGKLIL